MSLSEEDLATIFGRAERATDGPWFVGDHYREHLTVDGQFAGEARPIVAATNNDPGWSAWNANAEFIAAARTDVPELVAEVRRLHALVKKLRGIVAKQADQAITGFAEHLKKPIPCGHAIGDLIWAPHTVLKCGACLATRQTPR